MTLSLGEGASAETSGLESSASAFAVGVRRCWRKELIVVLRAMLHSHDLSLAGSRSWRSWHHAVMKVTCARSSLAWKLPQAL